MLFLMCRCDIFTSGRLEEVELGEEQEEERSRMTKTVDAKVSVAGEKKVAFVVNRSANGNAKSKQSREARNEERSIKWKKKDAWKAYKNTDECGTMLKLRLREIGEARSRFARFWKENVLMRYTVHEVRSHKYVGRGELLQCDIQTVSTGEPQATAGFCCEK